VRQDHPEFNWVICHVAHRTEFDGNKDEHWGHRHQEFDVKIGGNIGYDIYWFMSGTFVRLGDPGYINVRLPSSDSVPLTVLTRLRV
ncbi:hypothetical protein FA13DRAFT_1652609, partial [Coprinellus micaceus]